MKFLSRMVRFLNVIARKKLLIRTFKDGSKLEVILYREHPYVHRLLKCRLWEKLK